MVLNYLKIAYRNLNRDKLHSTINIVGLGIGIAVCILILMYIADELSFDDYHEYADRIYRVNRGLRQEDGATGRAFATLAPSFVPLLKDEFPEIETTVRILHTQQSTLQYEDRVFEENRFFFADEHIFEIFTIPLILGDPRTALRNPGDVILTQSTARKYFGDEDPLGKQLILDNQYPFQVVGIAQDAPRNTHFHYDFLASYSSLRGLYGEGENDYFWGTRNFSDNVTFAYVRLAEGVNLDELCLKIPDFIDRHLGSRNTEEHGIVWAHEWIFLNFMKVSDIHLHSHFMGEMEANSDIRYVAIFAVIAAFVLLIASTNYINLATTQAMQRSKEVGLRKVTGANRGVLIIQFFSETLCTTFLATLFAVLIAALALSFFNGITGKAIAFVSFIHPTNILLLITVFIITGILSGLYPALYISSFKPAPILRGEISRGRSANSFRTALVILQFAISIALITCIQTVSKQMNYIQNKKLGFDKENVVMFSMDPVFKERWQDVKVALLQNPNIMSVTASKRAPSGRLGDTPGFRIFLNNEWQHSPIHMPHNRVEHDFFRTYGMQIIAGRDFSTEYSSDALEAFIINETAARQLGFEKPADAVGVPLAIGNREGHIIGVVADFHYESLHRDISPIMTYIRMIETNTIAMRITDHDIQNTLSQIEATLHTFRPGLPVNFTFLSERLDQLYHSEMQLRKMLQYFSMLAILIACMGLFGLASFIIERRAKEIGIRKVLGASVSSITVMVTGDFGKWVLAANLLAIPAAYWFMHKWLQNYAYRVRIDAWTFIFSAIIALGVSILTVAYQAIRSATANPVKSLRYE